MTTAVDTNILIDFMTADPSARDAERRLDEAFHAGALIISEPVFAEIAGAFGAEGEVARFLVDMRVQLLPSSERVLFLAGVAWRRYSRHRSAAISCPRCGAANRLNCRACGERLTVRQHVLADFIIGAHALEHADALLTRDRRYYGTYFPKLRLI